MPITLTLKQYLDNPLGKGSGTIAGDQSATKKSYLDQMLSLKDQITLKWYNVQKKTLVCHIKMPSSTTKNSTMHIFYDIIFEFDIENIGNRVLINDLPLTVYSNCPSFVFTYANVFWNQNLICKWCKSKYSKVVYTHEPTERNTNKMIGYEKSLYICGLFLMQDQKNALNNIYQQAIVINNYNSILENIQHSDDIMAKLKAAQDAGKDVTKIDTSKVSSSRRTEAEIQLKNGDKFSPFVKKIKSIGFIGRTKNTEKIKTVKKSKKI